MYRNNHLTSKETKEQTALRHSLNSKDCHSSISCSVECKHASCLTENPLHPFCKNCTITEDIQITKTLQCCLLSAQQVWNWKIARWIKHVIHQFIICHTSKEGHPLAHIIILNNFTLIWNSAEDKTKIPPLYHYFWSLLLLFCVCVCVCVCLCVCLCGNEYMCVCVYMCAYMCV